MMKILVEVDTTAAAVEDGATAPAPDVSSESKIKVEKEPEAVPEAAASTSKSEVIKSVADDDRARDVMEAEPDDGSTDYGDTTNNYPNEEVTTHTELDSDSETDEVTSKFDYVLKFDSDYDWEGEDESEENESNRPDNSQSMTEVIESTSVAAAAEEIGSEARTEVGTDIDNDFLFDNEADGGFMFNLPDPSMFVADVEVKEATVNTDGNYVEEGAAKKPNDKDEMQPGAKDVTNTTEINIKTEPYAKIKISVETKPKSNFKLKITIN